MTGTAAIWVAFGNIFVSSVPAGIIHRMHAMGPVERDAKAACPVTRRTFDNRTRMALELLSGDIVVGVGVRIWPLRMSAAMTAFAFHPAVAFA